MRSMRRFLIALFALAAFAPNSGAAFVPVLPTTLLPSVHAVPYRGNVHVTVLQMPTAQKSLPVYALTPSPMRLETVHGLVSVAAPKASELAPFRPLQSTTLIAASKYQNLVIARIGTRVVALADVKAGVVHIIPSMTTLAPAAISAAVATKAAVSVFSRTDVIPKDVTSARPAPPITLMGATIQRKVVGRAPSVGPARSFLSYVPLRRYVADMPVYGSGSRALAIIGAGGRLQGFSRTWKVAQPSHIRASTLPPQAILQSIRDQLSPLTNGADVTVRSVKLVYYDGDGNYLEPAYRFTASISFRANDSKGTNLVKGDPADFLVGYVTAANDPEPIARVNRTQTLQPKLPSRTVGSSTSTFGSPDPSVGMYVDRNDDSDWVNDANEFWSGLNFSGSGNFSLTQYFWAEPFEFISDPGAFVDDVNVAMTEVHGNWWTFWTYQNWGDVVSLWSVPGYGGAAGGALDYWILHSCEVIPAPVDESTSYDVWWHIFGGLHSVLGYRTMMWIDDDAGWPFGFLAGAGVGAVPAWLEVIANLDAYDDGDTYSNEHGTHPYGRASTLSQCGHDGDSIYDTASLGSAGCLTSWWFND